MMRTKEEIRTDPKNGKIMSEIEFLLRCKIDFKFFCEWMLNLRDNGGIHPYAMDWFYLVQNNNNIVIKAPAGFAKTELIGVAYPLWRMWCNNPNKEFKVLLVSKTTRQAEDNLVGRVRNYVDDNEYLKELMPAGRKKIDNKTELKTVNRCWIKNVPYNMSIRGYRADLIVLDEADSYEDTELFFDEVISRIIPGGKIVLISTPKGPTALLGVIEERVKANPDMDYVFKVTPAIQWTKQGTDDISPDNLKTGKSIWPERFTIDELMRRRAAGENSFNANYLCRNDTEHEDTIFQIKDIIDCWDDDLDFDYTVHPEAQYFIGADFAISRGVRADYDAFIVVEKYRELLTIKHIEVHRGMIRPKKVNRLQDMSKQFTSNYPCKIVADESNMGTMVIDDLRALGVSVIPQKFHKAERDKLLTSLRNVFESRSLVIPHNPLNKKVHDFATTMFEQLIGFKRKTSEAGNELFRSTASHDDIVMSLAMAIKEATFVRPISILGISGN